MKPAIKKAVATVVVGALLALTPGLPCYQALGAQFSKGPGSGEDANASFPGGAPDFSEASQLPIEPASLDGQDLSTLDVEKLQVDIQKPAIYENVSRETAEHLSAQTQENRQATAKEHSVLRTESQILKTANAGSGEVAAISNSAATESKQAIGALNDQNSGKKAPARTSFVQFKKKITEALAKLKTPSQQAAALKLESGQPFDADVAGVDRAPEVLAADPGTIEAPALALKSNALNARKNVATQAQEENYPAALPGASNGQKAPVAQHFSLRSAARSATVFVGSLASTTREFFIGDPTLEWIIGPMRNARLITAGWSLAAGAISLASATVIGSLLDAAHLAHLGGSAAMAHLWLLLGASVALSAGSIVASWFVTYLNRTALLRSGIYYRSALARVLGHQEMAFHLEKEHESSKLASRVLNDTNYLGLKNVAIPIHLPLDVVLIFFGVSLMFFQNPLLSAVIAAVILPVGVVLGRLGQALVNLMFEMGNLQAKLTQRLQESFRQARAVKVLSSLQQEVSRVDETAREMMDIGLAEAKINRKYARLSLIMGFFTQPFIFIVGAFGLSGHLPGVFKSMTFGNITQMAAYASYAGASTNDMMTDYLLFKQYQGNSRIIRDFFNRTPAITDAPDAEKINDFGGDVRFENVSFSYHGSDSDAPTLDDISFHVEPGQTVAIVGTTGAGKSTIAKLLLRLWDAGRGRILLDGHDVRSLNRAEYLSRVAVVQQDTRLFNSTALYNMTYGTFNVSKEDELSTQDRARLDRAIGMAKADFVYDKARFPRGLETLVAEGGSRLSGGERQRIGIVRAILRDAPLLILDEATAKLDGPSENVVQTALEKVARGQEGRRPTVITIAHRLTTIKNADQILVMDRGRIIERGTHAELLAADGTYARLWRDGGYDDSRKTEVAAISNHDAAVSEPAPSTVENVDAEDSSAPAVAASAANSRRAGLRAGMRRKIRVVRIKLLRVWRSLATLILGDKEVKPYLASFRGQLRAAAVLMTLDAGLAIFMAIATGSILDAASLAIKLAIGAGMVGVYLVRFYTNPESGYLSNTIQARLKRVLTVELFKKLHLREMSFHMKQENNSGALAAHVTNDMDSLVYKNTALRLPLASEVIQAILGTILLLHTSWLIGLLVLGMVPVLGIINGWAGEKSEHLYELFQQKRAEFGRVIQELFENILAVKSFAQEDHEATRASRNAEALANVGIEQAKPQAFAGLTDSITTFMTQNLIYILGALLLTGTLFSVGGFTIGKIAEMVFFAGFIKSGFSGLAGTWLSFKSEHGETKFLRRAFTAQPRIRDVSGAVDLPNGQGDVRFEDVNFRYEAQGGNALENISFEAKPGQTIAFVGESGSGKSTILSLLQRLWAPQSGHISIDGQDIKTAKMQSISDALSVIPQDPPLFDESLRYNMLYGTKDVTQQQLMAAIHMARADFYKNMPEGLDTRIGEGGNQLSGGQAQRVAIVRALLKQSRILVLDEATAALDKSTEKDVQASIDGLRQGDGASERPTTLVVAHNLPTIINADRIYVLSRGRIVASGTHQELMKQSRAYRDLWAAFRKQNPAAQ